MARMTPGTGQAVGTRSDQRAGGGDGPKLGWRGWLHAGAAVAGGIGGIGCGCRVMMVLL